MIHSGKDKVRTVRWIEWIQKIILLLIFYLELLLLGKRKNAISKSKGLNLTLHEMCFFLLHFFPSFGIRVEEVREFYNYQKTFNLFIGIVYLVNCFCYGKIYC